MAGYNTSTATLLGAAIVILTTAIYFCRNKRNLTRRQVRSASGGSRRNSFTVGDELLERPLGSMEKALHYIQQESAGLLGSAFMVISEVPCDRNVLGLAVALLAERHPLLRMRIVTRNLSPSDRGQAVVFQEDACLRVEMTVKEGVENWIEELEHQLMCALPREGLLWRATYLPDAVQQYTDKKRSYQHTFVFTFHPVIIDGASLASLMSEFFQFVEQLQQYPGEEFMITSLPLPPVAEEMTAYFRKRQPLRFPQSLLPALAIFPVCKVKELVAGILSRSGKWWTARAQSLNTDCLLQEETIVVPIRFSKNETSQLASRCKQEFVTVVDAFWAAFGFAWKEAIDDGLRSHQPGLPFQIRTNFIVDMRRHSVLAKDEIIVKSFDPDVVSHVAALSVPLVVQTTLGGQTLRTSQNFWSLARKHKSLTETDLVDTIVRSVSQFKRFTEQASGLYSENESRTLIQPEDFDMTHMDLGNIKQLNRSESAPLKAVALHVASAGSHRRNALYNTLVTVEGALFWTMSCSINVMSKHDAEKFAQTLYRILSNALSE